MIYHSITDPLTLTDAIHATRAALAAAGHTRPANDDEITAALAAALTAWDIADPLIYYYRPGVPSVAIPDTWLPTDCYAGTPEPDHAVTWTQNGNTITAPTSDPTWRITWARALPPIPNYEANNAIIDNPLPIVAYTSGILTLAGSATFHAPPSPGQTVAILATQQQEWHGLYGIMNYDPLQQTWLLARITTQDYIPVRAPTGQTQWHTPAGWQISPPAAGNIARHHTPLVATRAAAQIILARTDAKHTAHDWAEHTIAQPWPPSTAEATSHGIRTRADYVE